MKPSDETIEKFRAAYLEHFGEEISKQEAYERFLRLVNLLRVILRPDLQNDADNFDQNVEHDKI